MQKQLCPTRKAKKPMIYFNYNLLNRVSDGSRTLFFPRNIKQSIVLRPGP